MSAENTFFNYIPILVRSASIRPELARGNAWHIDDWTTISWKL